jgi:hypothetical protein
MHEKVGKPDAKKRIWEDNIVACFATEDAALIGNWLLLQSSPVVTTRNYYMVTLLHSLESLHANIPFYLFGASGIHLETADR